MVMVGGRDPRGMMCWCYMVSGEKGERGLSEWNEEGDEGKRRGTERGRRGDGV